MEEKPDEQTTETKLTALEQVLAGREAELAEAKTRVVALETTLMERENELKVSRQQLAEAQDKVTVTGKALAETVEGYRTLVLQSNPDIAEELVGGDSITTINESVVKAKALIGRVRQSVEKETTRRRVPLGAPGRQSADVTSLSPREKIQYAIGGRK